jgi:hypothetical protein
MLATMARGRTGFQLPFPKQAFRSLTIGERHGLSEAKKDEAAN